MPKQIQIPYTLNFKKISSKDLMVVGGKGSNLGEMTRAGVPVPPGFVVTTRAYNEFLDSADLRQPITDILTGLDVNDTKALNATSKRVKKLILEASVPSEIRKKVVAAYSAMSGFTDALVAVRSSATAEDIPGASFAGQQATFLNVKGPRNLMKAVQGCWASLFEPRAIFYRETKGFDHMNVSIAVPVQKMVQSEVSGVMFTMDPVTNDQKFVTIEAVFGLGETIVSGEVTPDYYLVDKGSLAIKEKHIVKQKWMLVRRGRPVKGEPNVKVSVSKAWKQRQKLSDKFVKKLAKIGKMIEKHYKYPQDIEWAFAGNKLWIVQSRPVTTLEVPEEKMAPKIIGDIEAKDLKKQQKERTREISKAKKVTAQKIDLGLLLEGVPASPGVVSAKARVIKDVKSMGKLKEGEILITTMTTPAWVPIMKKASAVVTDQGGATAHAAIVSRELGIPCVVGTQVATKIIKTREWITIDGGGGRVYEGKLKEKAAKISRIQTQITEPAQTSEARLDIPKSPKVPEYKRIKTATKVYVNLGEPDLAKEISEMDVDGVGLLRAEFMLATFGVHPNEAIKTVAGRKTYIKNLEDGIAKFCKAFGPNRPIIYRTTDFKTNEYMALKGGEEYEFEENNPMMGYRGVSRYLDNPDVFNLELEAIKHIRNKRGFKNLWVMLPFVRTVNELVQAKKLISSAGLRRSSTFKLFMMVEIPSNVILIDDFIAVGIDGVSMGTNDLTQLTLGVDRDNPKVQGVFDERDSAVQWSMERVVRACHKNKILCSICGQAPSVYPEITKNLVKWGVTSVSVNADMLHQTREIVADVEKKLIRRKRK